MQMAQGLCLAIAAFLPPSLPLFSPTCQKAAQILPNTHTTQHSHIVSCVQRLPPPLPAPHGLFMPAYAPCVPLSPSFPTTNRRKVLLQTITCLSRPSHTDIPTQRNNPRSFHSLSLRSEYTSYFSPPKRATSLDLKPATLFRLLSHPPPRSRSFSTFRPPPGPPPLLAGRYVQTQLEKKKRERERKENVYSASERSRQCIGYGASPVFFISSTRSPSQHQHHHYHYHYRGHKREAEEEREQ